MSTMDKMPWLHDLEPSPALAGAQTLTDITRNVARVLGVPMSSSLADMVRQQVSCEVNYNGYEKTVVGTHNTVLLPDESGYLTEPIFAAETALEVAQIAITAWWREHLPSDERARLDREFQEEWLEDLGVPPVERERSDD